MRSIVVLLFAAFLALTHLQVAHADSTSTGPLVSATPTVEVLTGSYTPPPTVSARSGTFVTYAVPTSDASLRRITTAPNGDMWFVERDKNKIGRITLAGGIEEFTLPTQTTDESWVKDLDVDASGNVWVVWDQGWKVSRYTPSTSSFATWNFENPYGEEVRVGPTAVWVTASYDEKGIVKITGNDATWDQNAPECDGPLGAGRDGLMWCQQFNKLIQVNAAGNGGITHPLPANATYPYSVATGPSEWIWFGRDNGGSMFTSPANGNIGWIGFNNTVHTIALGSRVAPRSLVTGADGKVWFTSVGAAKGIGHLGVDGRGAITQVGNFSPTSVTYGKDGNIWATDATNNAIIRVSRADLQVTNVDVGDGSQMKPHQQPKVKAKGKVNANKSRKKAKLKVSCAAGAVPCQGKIVVKAGKKKVAKGVYAVAAGSKGKVTLKLTGKARKLLAARAKVGVKVTFKPATGGTNKSRSKLTR